MPKKCSKRENNAYYMYGKHSVLAALHNKQRIIEKLYCLEKQYQSLDAALPHLTKEIVSNDFIISKIGQNQTHQGIIAKVKTIFQYGLNHCNFVAPTKIAILDQITDPQNIGSIIRSGVAFGIDKFILPVDNTPDENAIIAKAACGTLELATVIKVINLKQTIDTLKNQGFWIAGLDINGQNRIADLTNISKLAVIIGSEGKGMRHLTNKSCDFLVNIPIISEVESLNAANAASIIFYEISDL